MEFKGTKGKWYLKYSKTDEGFKISSGIDLVCITRCVQREDKANALLISKAPEMLEMLNILLYDYKNYTQNILQDIHRNNRINEIEKLIKQATDL